MGLVVIEEHEKETLCRFCYSRTKVKLEKSE